MGKGIEHTRRASRLVLQQGRERRSQSRAPERRGTRRRERAHLEEPHDAVGGAAEEADGGEDGDGVQEEGHVDVLGRRSTCTRREDGGDEGAVREDPGEEDLQGDEEV